MFVKTSMIWMKKKSLQIHVHWELKFPELAGFARSENNGQAGLLSTPSAYWMYTTI